MFLQIAQFSAPLYMHFIPRISYLPGLSVVYRIVTLFQGFMPSYLLATYSHACILTHSLTY